MTTDDFRVLQPAIRERRRDLTLQTGLSGYEGSEAKLLGVFGRPEDRPARELRDRPERRSVSRPQWRRSSRAGSSATPHA